MRRPAKSCLSLLRDRRGGVAVEFGLISAVLLVLVIGAIETGRVLMARNEVSYALGRAARMLLLDGEQTTNEVETAVGELLADYDPERLGIAAQNTTVGGVDYMQITVTFEVETSLKLGGFGSVEFSTATSVPVVSGT